MFHINKQTDYALVTIAYLRDKKGYIPLSDLISETNMPQRFLARIMAELVRHKILESKEGKTGGYKLIRDPKNISLYGFLKIFDEDLNMVGCADPTYKCSCSSFCHHKRFFKENLTSLLTDQLKRWTVADAFK